MKMFTYFVVYLLKFWIICCKISKIASVTNETHSSTSSIKPSPQLELLTFSSFYEEFTAATPEPEWNLFNVKIEDMNEYIKRQRKVRGYLAGFENDFQRFLVENQLKYCPYVSHCDLKINAKTDMKSCCEPCSCDSLCEGGQSCCPGVMNETEFNNDSKTMILFNDVNMLVPFIRAKEQKISVKPTCNLRHLTIRPSYEQKGFAAVSGCSDLSDIELFYNCTRPYTDNLRIKYTLPAYSNTSLTVFRNKYCALCNGVHEKDILYFTPSVSCVNKEHLLTEITSERDIVELMFANESCDLSYAISDERIKLAECKYVISRCNVTAAWKEYDIYLDIACNLYESRFMHEKYMFRNVFCAMCNGITPHTITCPLRHILATDVFSFSGLLNLDFDQGFSTAYLAQNRGNQEHSCNTKQLYDALTNRCKDIYCPEMRVFRNGRCISTFTNVQYVFVYNVYIRLKPLSKLSAVDVFANDLNWLYNLESVFKANFSKHVLCEAQLLFKLDLDFGKSTLYALSRSRLQYVDARIQLAGLSEEPWTVADNLLNLHGTNVKIPSNHNTSTTYIIYVMDNDARIFDITKRLFIDRVFITNFFASETPEKRIEIVSKYALTDADGLTILPYTVSTVVSSDCHRSSHRIDVIRFSSCPKVNLSKEDIPWTKDLDGIVFNTLKIPSNSYYFIDHLHIMVCTKMFQKIVDHLTPKRALTTDVIISIMCSSLSILSLLLTFAVYCMIPKLRTPLPGKNNMSLTVNLLAAQILLLVGSLGPFEQFSTSCKTVGVLIHFIWLCAVFWMNVCTYHMFRVLTNTHASMTDFGIKTFVFYTLYVCIMSVVFVLANIISSTITSSNIGYGGKFCYIISREKLLFTFVLPTLVVIVLNISLFLAVIIKIKRAPNIRKHVKNEHNDIVIFAKLSTITGLTWVFGFLYLWSSIQTFSYIFTVLNAGQGVFIFLAFVINRNVMNLCKEKIKFSNNSLHTSSRSSNRTNSSKL